MSKIDYQVLREAAEKATCGEWSLEYGEERFDAGDALIHREVVGYLPICRIEGAHPEGGFELGGYATSNLSGAYNMFSEFWNVAVSAAPKVDDL